MTNTGTSHFPSLLDAIRYYRPQGYNADDVEDKITDKEISIGKPRLKEGETLEVIGGRYHIISE